MTGNIKRNLRQLLKKYLSAVVHHFHILFKGAEILLSNKCVFQILKTSHSSMLPEISKPLPQFDFSYHSFNGSAGSSGMDTYLINEFPGQFFNKVNIEQLDKYTRKSHRVRRGLDHDICCKTYESSMTIQK